MKKPLKPIGLCEICGREKATQCHERFPDTKTNFRLYGDLLYARRQAGEARRSEIMARSEAARALLKLEIDSHSLWVVHDEDGG